jgi:hypothetical protein
MSRAASREIRVARISLSSNQWINLVPWNDGVMNCSNRGFAPHEPSEKRAKTVPGKGEEKATLGKDNPTCEDAKFLRFGKTVSDFS